MASLMLSEGNITWLEAAIANSLISFTKYYFATHSILGTIDVFDCLLATLGDPGVEEVYRRQVFGLFQDLMPDHPQRIRDLAAKFAHIKKTVHGVLFLFKEPDTGMIAYRLEQYMVWNAALIDDARARPIFADIASAIPVRPFRQ